MKVYLKYAFMFDPAETWSQQSQFDSTLMQFLDKVGLRAEVVENVKGQEAMRILLITKKPQNEMPMKADQTPKTQKFFALKKAGYGKPMDDSGR